ncbi:MAG: transglutaminase-like domain-containing protein [Candidatus Binatia bacterium]|nr:transglutaminase-like domain-containing protein [Candidatus Binatia bacterium]
MLAYSFRIGVVLFWLVMVALLVQRTMPTSLPPPSTLPVTESVHTVGEEWMGIYHHQRKIGYLQRRLSPTTTGYTWEEQWRMRLQVGHSSHTVHTEIRAQTDRHYALTSFSLRLLSGGTTFQVSGEVADTTLRGQIKTGDDVTPFSFPLRDPIYLPATTQLALRGGRLQPGDQYQFTIFHPLSMRTETLTVTVLGSEVLPLRDGPHTLLKVAERIGDLTVHAWLDAAGNVVKEEAQLGLVLLRESEADALGAGWQDHTPLDLVATTAIPVRTPLPSPRHVTQLQIRLLGIADATAFAFPPRQQWHEGIVTIATEEVSSLVSYPLPHADPRFAADLQATPFLQSTHPRVVAQAQQILRGERDALRAVQALLAWTHTTLDKTPSVGMPTALDALERKRGDCNEHAVLFAALARAVGIPARVVAGVVYLDSAFYYHAWAEVWLGQWVAVDPALNQFPADATHVKFVDGGPEQHLALLKVIGQVGIEVTGYR